MLLVDDILLAPLSALLWVFKEIRAAGEEELASEPDRIMAALRTLHMQLEAGLIEEAEFDVREGELLDRLDAVNDALGKGEDDDEENEDDDGDEDEEQPNDDGEPDPGGVKPA
ncbi:MAG: gas vesicle protein GvpG [Armatimonadetes bacterium]|nr:gas vesicle protein GvpG [Armatimonadota bacterium]